MKFIVGVVVGFVAAHMKSFDAVAIKLADGMEIAANKLHAWTHPDKEKDQ